MKTLVIVLAETRAAELSFTNFKTNVIDALGADLCVCIGVASNYDYENPYYKLAKYRFLYKEPEDYADAFEYASNIIKNSSPPNIHELSPDGTILPPLYWREFLKIKKQFMGGIKDDNNQHPGSAGILIFFRWFLLQCLYEDNLVEKYDRFIITRSDYIYQLPHIELDLLDNKCIWIPNGEYYGGFTDRHVILSREHIIPYLNILNNMVLKSNEYYNKMLSYDRWNLETLIKFHLTENGVINLVREIPYVMYAVRPINGTTRWAKGTYSEEYGYFIKYPNEYKNSCDYKANFEESRLTIRDFYRNHIDTKLI